MSGLRRRRSRDVHKIIKFYFTPHPNPPPQGGSNVVPQDRSGRVDVVSSGDPQDQPTRFRNLDPTLSYDLEN